MTETQAETRTAYAIWVEHHYLRGALDAPKDGWVHGDAHEAGDGLGHGALVFPTREAAQDHARRLRDMQVEGGDYRLSHGEHARPSFDVRPLGERAAP